MHSFELRWGPVSLGFSIFGCIVFPQCSSSFLWVNNALSSIMRTTGACMEIFWQLLSSIGTSNRQVCQDPGMDFF